MAPHAILCLRPCNHRMVAGLLLLLFFFCDVVGGNNNEDSSCVQSDDPNEISVSWMYEVGYLEKEGQLIEFLTDVINDGWLDILGNGKYLRVAVADSGCDATAATKAYWDVRKENCNRPMQAILGAWCSSASIALASTATQENVTQLSFASTSSKLSDTFTFPYFSRMVAPADNTGQAAALVATLREFGWKNVNILITDKEFSRNFMNEFRSIWELSHEDESGSWEGKVEHDGIIRINSDDTVDEASARQELEEISETSRSRIILFLAHDKHAFDVLSFAENDPNFRKDIVWVGVSGWVDAPEWKSLSMDWPSNQRRHPGYIGLRPIVQKESDLYMDTLSEMQEWQKKQGKEVWDDFPSFWASYMIDSIVAIVKALAQLPPESRRDGALVTKTLRENVTFQGLTGEVAFDPIIGDRTNARYGVMNLQRKAEDDDVEWVEVGSTGIYVGSTEIDKKLICFPGEDSCGTGIPNDLRPKGREKLPKYAVALIIVPFILLAIVLDKYRRSRKSKQAIKRLQKSMKGLWKVEKYYIPDVARENDVELGRNHGIVERVKQQLNPLADAQIPADIMTEPQMVLVEGDFIQVTTERNDGWAFGSKISNNDVGLTRRLVDLINNHGTAEAGWFPKAALRRPTPEELEDLNLGPTRELEAPKHWSQGEDILIPLSEEGTTAQEYTKVKDAFVSTIGIRNASIQSIRRVENLAMWQGYVVKRKTMIERELSINPQQEEKSLCEELERRWLWHGTDQKSMEKIIHQGFNKAFCGKNATRYGKGVYFAAKTSKSANPRYSPLDESGIQYIFACRVMVGRHCVGWRDLLAPELRDATRELLYDSTTDRKEPPTEYVSYSDTQSYPEYVIAFKQSFKGQGSSNRPAGNGNNVSNNNNNNNNEHAHDVARVCSDESTDSCSSSSSESDDDSHDDSDDHSDDSSHDDSDDSHTNHRD